MSAKPLADRFWNKVKKTNTCWEWIATKSMVGGYGVINNNKKAYRAHRVSYELAYGPIEDKSLFVCHKCDNPGCVRPDHLFLGTHEQNQQDKRDKGRQSRGEQMGLSKLTPDQVMFARNIYEREVITYTDIAYLLGVSYITIRSILLRKTWRHI